MFRASYWKNDNLANPFRTAHQLADTAMAKANTAVYSASSLEG